MIKFYFGWRIISKFMLWLYRREWTWKTVPTLFTIAGFIIGIGLALMVVG
ncbi:MAG: hypothetical protein JXA42_18470 [Anaerolineales bacterium]|nr:hypothetical protein [Anaerolineales bacterium]